MNAKDITTIINEIESNFDVKTWFINNIRVWPLIRLKLANVLYEGNKLYIKSSTMDKILFFIRKVFVFIKGLVMSVCCYFIDIKHNDYLYKNADVVFLGHSTSRVCKIEDRFFDAFIDPIIEKGSSIRQFLVLEYAPKDEYRIPRYNKSYFIQFRIYLTMLVNKVLTFLSIRHNLITMNESSAFLSFLNSKKINFGSKDLDKLISDINYIELLSKYFKKIISVNKCSKGYVVCYYGHVGMAFNLACRQQGIPAIDIQHGGQGIYHVAYGKWLNVPMGGYELLPSSFLCWDEESSDAINGWSKNCKPNHQAYTGGNLYLEMFKDETSSFVKLFDERVRKILNDKYKIKILITLQTGIGLTKLFKDIMSKSSKNCFWWVRLHPSMSSNFSDIKKEIEDLGVVNCYLDDTKVFPIHGVLRNISLHITEFSGTTIEAENFNVFSILCNDNAKFYFGKQLLNGTAVIKHNADDILDIINKYNSEGNKSV